MHMLESIVYIPFVAINQTLSDKSFAVYFMEDVNLLEFLFHVSFILTCVHLQDYFYLQYTLVFINSDCIQFYFNCILRNMTVNFACKLEFYFDC